MAGGYDVAWKHHLGPTIANNDGRCIYNGAPFDPLNPFEEGFKECRQSINKIASSMTNKNPIRLGEMSWKTHNFFDVSMQETPGVITFDFVIHFFDSDVEYNSGSMTKIIVQPSKFRVMERPDEIYFSVHDNNGQEIAQITTSVAPDFGIDPPVVYLGFVDRSLVSTEKGLALTLTDNNTLLKKIASGLIQGITAIHKFIWEVFVPGGSIIVRALELPAVFDYALDIDTVITKLQMAVERDDREGVKKALMGLYKNIYGLGFKLTSFAVSTGTYAKQVDKAFEGQLPRNPMDLGTVALSDALSRVADILMAENLIRISSLIMQPTSTKPASTKPASTKPASTKPASTKSTSKKPTSTKPTSTKPASTKPASTKPAQTKRPSRLARRNWYLHA
ncbi:hypothetical protein TWF679_000234 [Orbilia oligospora]|uniref:Uncharacterized protein n=1 Tax=Orbilia oligospora TaxID=2813651 RepID=A0A8H8VNF8_ORBOL|nr:hypothetical protein TWF679_000234 [Orbilia oligospora]